MRKALNRNSHGLQPQDKQSMNNKPYIVAFVSSVVYLYSWKLEGNPSLKGLNMNNHGFQPVAKQLKKTKPEGLEQK